MSINKFLFRNEHHVVDGVVLCKNLSEYGERETEVLVKGRLKESVSYWEKLGRVVSKWYRQFQKGMRYHFSKIPQPSS